MLYSESINIDDIPLEDTLGEKKTTKNESEDESSSLGGEIAYLEISTSLKSMKFPVIWFHHCIL